MKKQVFAFLLCGLPFMINAQDANAFDVLQMSQTELRGTSRFQSMAGAFGALGGDLSTLTQNPAGIGVYRNSDLGVTFSLDFNSAKSGETNLNETKFNVNNVGYVGAIRLDSESVPNINFGFTYNRLHSYNRHYKGVVANIPRSMSCFIADEQMNFNPNGPFYWDDLYRTDTFDPYLDGSAPLAAVSTFDMQTNNDRYVGIINVGDNGMMGLMGTGTTGEAKFDVTERGHVDEYNIAFGGNIANKVYLGLDFGIMDLDYKRNQSYTESLNNAYIMLDDYDLFQSPIDNNNTHANWGLYNYLHSKGKGVNFKLGFIWKPTQALRIGAAFHTPTYYDMHDRFFVDASLDAYQNGTNLYYAEKKSPEFYDDYTIKTPWHFLGSLAGVIGTNGIISMDYEYVANETMRMGDVRDNDYPDVTDNVKTFFKPSHIVRIGGEYRVNPSWSLRAGYSIKTSQVEKGEDYNVATATYNPSYQYDDNVHHITCGVGYRYKSFYTDLAYVHKIRNSVFNAFTVIDDVSLEKPLDNVHADVTDHNNRVSLTLGMRF